MIKETFSPEETFAFGKWIGENALPGQRPHSILSL